MNCCVSKFLLGAIVAALFADACAFVAQPHLLGIRVATTHRAKLDDQMSDVRDYLPFTLPCCSITHNLPYP